MSVTFDGVGGLDNREYLSNVWQYCQVTGEFRYQPVERDGRSSSTVSRAVPTIWYHSTSRCAIPWAAWNRSILFSHRERKNAYGNIGKTLLARALAASCSTGNTKIGQSHCSMIRTSPQSDLLSFLHA